MVVFHWRLSDSKSSQVFRTLLSILADLNNSLVSLVSILSIISISSHLLSSYYHHHHHHQFMLFFPLLWSATDSKSPQLSKNLLNNHCQFMLCSGWIQPLSRSPISSISFPGSLGLFPVLQLWLVSLSPSCSVIVFMWKIISSFSYLNGTSWAIKFITWSPGAFPSGSTCLAGLSLSFGIWGTPKGKCCEGQSFLWQPC